MHVQRKPFPNIQILRGLAALMVAVFHLTASLIHADMPNPLPNLDLGNFGVDLFFVISGFIMFYTAGADVGPAAPRRFLVRRFIRVIPIYWIFTSIAFWGMARDYGSAPISTFQRWHVLASYLFIPFRELEDQSDVAPIYGVGWTLQYEMMFYVCFAAAMLLAPKLRLSLLSGGFVVLVLAGRALSLPLPLSFWADPIILEFVFGMAIAWVARSGATMPAAAALALGAAAVGVLALETAADVGAEALRALWWGLPAAAMVSAAVFARSSPGGRPARALERALEGLGDASYSLYLVHPFIYNTMIGLCRGAILGHRLQFRVFLPMMLVGAVLAALVCYRLVERPLTRALQKRLLGRVSFVPATPAAVGD